MRTAPFCVPGGRRACWRVSSWHLSQVAPDGVGNYQSIYYDVNPRAPIDPITGATGVIYSTLYGTGTQNWGTRDGIYDKAGNFYEVVGAVANFFRREYRTTPAFPSTTALPLPSVVSAGQRSGTSLVDVVYRVEDADSATVQTGLLAFLNGGSALTQVIPMRTFVEGTAGNVGASQPSGTNLSAVWDMTADWAADFADIRVEVLANDGRNLRGIHWIEIPVDGALPAVEVSADPISDDQLVEAWFWMLATRPEINVQPDPRATAEARVFADSGIFANATLVEYAGPYYARYPRTTKAGRAMLYQAMGGRSVNRSEITRANLGNYNFGTVNELNITKGDTSPSAFLKSWGVDDYGELPWLPFNGGVPTRVVNTGSTSLYLVNDNRLWGLGWNGYGQLGTGDAVTQSLAIPIADNVVYMSLGASHAVYITADEKLWGLGRNNSGQLGVADTANQLSPVLIDTQVAQVAAGGDWTFYVKTDGTLYQATTAGPVSLTTGVAKAFISDRGDGFYITTGGELWGWGRNENQVLGAVGANKPFADRVLIDQDVADAAVGWDFLVYRKTGGSMWGLGENEYNQINPGSTANVTAPFQMEAADVVEVAAGYDHVVYRLTGNTVRSRGYNYAGQTGNGTYSNVTGSSVQVDSNVSTISAGGHDSHWVTFTTAP